MGIPRDSVIGSSQVSFRNLFHHYGVLPQIFFSISGVPVDGFSWDQRLRPGILTGFTLGCLQGFLPSYLQHFFFIEITPGIPSMISLNSFRNFFTGFSPGSFHRSIPSFFQGFILGFLSRFLQNFLNGFLQASFRNFFRDFFQRFFQGSFPGCQCRYLTAFLPALSRYSFRNPFRELFQNFFIDFSRLSFGECAHDPFRVFFTEIISGNPSRMHLHFKRVYRNCFLK